MRRISRGEEKHRIISCTGKYLKGCHTQEEKAKDKQTIHEREGKLNTKRVVFKTAKWKKNVREGREFSTTEDGQGGAIHDA